MFEPNLKPISLIPNTIFTIFGINFNSSVLSAFFITFLISIISFISYKKVKLIPGLYQSFVEMLIEFFYNQCKLSFGSEKKAKNFISFIITLFLFILISNQFSLIPLMQDIVVNKTNIFTTPTAHLSQTLTLSLMVIIVSHVAALYFHPVQHINSIINFKKIFSIKKLSDIPNALLEIFLGILNLIGELSKVISLSARLFGNIFAGQVVIAVISGLSVFTMFIVPIPFIILSTFSGLIQAFVFAFLAISFLSGTITTKQ